MTMVPPSCLQRRASRWLSAARAVLACLLMLVLMPASLEARGATPAPAQDPASSVRYPASSLPPPLGGFQPGPALRWLPASGIQLPARPRTLGAADPPPNCRYGTIAGSSQTGWLSALGAGWYYDYATHPPQQPEPPEYAHMIRVLQNKTGCTYLDGYTTSPPLTESGLGLIIATHPGALWMVGNEPDRGPNPDKCAERGQDDTFPEVYAQAYHDAYRFIKAHDPTASVANAGLVQVTPGRLQYLDKMWDAYQKRYGMPMPVDVWNMHIYILPETTVDGYPNWTANVALGTDPALGKRESGGDPARCPDPNVYCWAEHDDMGVFGEQVVAMRDWMKAHGQQDKPLILSEYSILYPYEIDPGGTCYLQDEYGNCFTPDRVRAFMQASLDLLESAADPSLGYPLDGFRLVQRWNWFQVHTTGLAYVSNLVDGSPLALTQLGELYRSRVAAHGSYVNLAPDAIAPVSAHASGALTSALVTVQVHNTGTTANPVPYTITFYADAALKQPIGSIAAPAGPNGCTRQSVTGALHLGNLPPGAYPIWAWVDSAESVTESIESDNVASGVVTVYPHARWFPLVYGQ
jgi:hypothetical protein